VLAEYAVVLKTQMGVVVFGLTLVAIKTFWLVSGSIRAPWLVIHFAS
jgi:hypothetical protein